jgi:hypothetical protein
MVIQSLTRLYTALFLILSLTVAPAVAQTVDIEAFSEEAYRDALEQEAFTIGVQAYIYGRAPMMSYEWRYSGLWDESFTPIKGELNRISHFRQPWNPDFGGAAANRDVVYSEAWVDVSREAYIIDFPQTDGRYYSIQFFDFYTNTISFSGRHTYGSKAIKVLLLGPEWQGRTPATVDSVVRSPTNIAYFVIRTFVKDDRDLQTVHALQDKYCLTPLENWSPGIACDSGRGTGSKSRDYPLPPTFDLSDPLNYFVFLNHVLNENPPPHEAGLMRLFARINLGPGQRFEIDSLHPSVAEGLRKAIPVATRIIDMAIQGQLSSKVVNGWDMTVEIGRHFQSYLMRAAVAKQLPHPLPSEGAIYPRVMVDSEGRRLNGSHRYTLTFEKEQIPVTDAFWSLSIYDDKTRFVENEIDRYNISDRTEGIQFGKDGSLTIYIQTDQPVGRESNWLPAPGGEFFMVLRVYQPSQLMQKGNYAPPAVERVD